MVTGSVRILVTARPAGAGRGPAARAAIGQGACGPREAPRAGTAPGRGPGHHPPALLHQHPPGRAGDRHAGRPRPDRWPAGGRGGRAAAPQAVARGRPHRAAGARRPPRSRGVPGRPRPRGRRGPGTPVGLHRGHPFAFPNSSCTRPKTASLPRPFFFRTTPPTASPGHFPSAAPGRAPCGMVASAGRHPRERAEAQAPPSGTGLPPPGAVTATVARTGRLAVLQSTVCAAVWLGSRSAGIASSPAGPCFPLLAR